jgi:DNA-binding transcriptional LysR family regulator
MIAKLEMFLAVAKEEHFGRAAESLGITQPTLSTGIRQLEESLGVQLIFRGHRYGGLTPEGQRALVWARSLVSDARTFREEMRAARHGLSGHIRLAVIPTALTWAATLSARFAEAHPNVRFSILSRTSAEILAMMENLDIDAGLSYLDNEPLGRVVTVPIYRERYVLVCRSDSDLAAGPRGLGRSGGAAAVPSDPGHAEPAHHQPELHGRRRHARGAGRKQLHPRSRLPCAGGRLADDPALGHGGDSGGRARHAVRPDGRSDGAAYRRPVAPYREPHTPVLEALAVRGAKACENGEIRRLRRTECRPCFIRDFYQSTELRY